jgi:hypothetical protein
MAIRGVSAVAVSLWAIVALVTPADAPERILSGPMDDVTGHRRVCAVDHGTALGEGERESRQRCTAPRSVDGEMPCLRGGCGFGQGLVEDVETFVRFGGGDGQWWY